MVYTIQNHPVSEDGHRSSFRNVIQISEYQTMGKVHLDVPSVSYQSSGPSVADFLQTVKNAVFWDMTPCVSCKNRRFGHHIPEDGIHRRVNLKPYIARG
jgi:hypothetical protein